MHKTIAKIMLAKALCLLRIIWTVHKKTVFISTKITALLSGKPNKDGFL